jgi:hypothetical protein
MDEARAPAYTWRSPPAGLLRDVEAVRHHQVQLLLGARHRHVQQAALLLDVLRVPVAMSLGMQPSTHVQHVHRLPLLALGEWMVDRIR